MQRFFLIAPLLKFAEGLRFRQLFLLTAGLFGIDLLLPDLLPFVDEILLGLLTLLFAALRKPKPKTLETDN